ncbi:MAG TPA: hypothetical protein VKN73_13070 [Desulfosalsimonadaceae bacterium]|nr:hypothetical protein [Desulfosalsimonadaceae bacterium]
MKSILLALILAAMAACVGLAVQFHPGRASTPASDGGQSTQKKYPLHITGFEITDVKEGVLQSVISADALKINKRRFFIFQFNPVTECTVDQLEIEIYADDGADVFESIGQGLLSDPANPFRSRQTPNFGLITRGVVNHLILSIFRNNQLSLKVEADRAVIDFEAGSTELFSVKLTDMIANRTIQSRTAELDNRARVLNIKDTAYRLAAGQIIPH